MGQVKPYQFRFLNLLDTPEDSPSCGGPVVQGGVQAASSSKALAAGAGRV
jgi:hypothetical protein